MKQRIRHAEATRERLLTAAFDHFQRNGYNATALRDVLAGVGITSGALFHHFENKEALGLAVMQGPVAKIIEEWWIDPLADYATAFEAVRETLKKLEQSMLDGERRLGCPLGNAASELSNHSSGLSSAIRQIFDRWQEALAAKIEADQAAGALAEDVDPAAVATFIVAGIEGAIALTKVRQSVAPIRALAGQLDRYFAALTGELGLAKPD